MVFLGGAVLANIVRLISFLSGLPPSFPLVHM